MASSHKHNGYKHFSTVTHRSVTIDHYYENGKYFVDYYKNGLFGDYCGTYQVRGLKEPLTDNELRIFIDKEIERCLLERERRT